MSAQELTPEAWEALSGELEEIERHPTGLCGDIVVCRGPGVTFVVMEAPRVDRRYVRKLPDREAVDAFLARRLAQIERMWDG